MRCGNGLSAVAADAADGAAEELNGVIVAVLLEFEDVTSAVTTVKVRLSLEERFAESVGVVLTVSIEASPLEVVNAADGTVAVAFCSRLLVAAEALEAAELLVVTDTEGKTVCE